ncbi:hypothetical protein M3J09_009834 [Ascochyta lentis]
MANTKTNRTNPIVTNKPCYSGRPCLDALLDPLAAALGAHWAATFEASSSVTTGTPCGCGVEWPESGCFQATLWYSFALTGGVLCGVS